MAELYLVVLASCVYLACCCLTDPCFPLNWSAALAKYGKGQATDDLAMAVELLFERNLLPRLPPQAQIVTNDFRMERLYAEEVRTACQRSFPAVTAPCKA